MTADDLRTLLGPFADPATPVEVTAGATFLRLRMTREGGEREYLLDTTTGTVKARHDASRQYASVDSLLASADFADIRSMALTQQRLLAEKGGAPFLEPNLRIGQPAAQATGLDTLREHMRPGAGRTRLILLDGPAGIGKTYLLEHLTWERAGQHIRGEGVAPILYVSSHGQRLSSLRNTVAAASQVIRAKFTFEHVPLLVRRGLLGLAIDGFDELVDADGYQDAWYALRDFLSELGGGGLCLLAGRDTFFDQQGFLTRLQSVSAQVDLVQAHLSTVEPQRAKSWLLQQGWPHAEVHSPETDEILQPGSYTLRPYFLSVLAEARGWQQFAKHRTARAFLVERFIEREAALLEKLVDLQRAQARKGLEQMFEECALDMAERERSYVDVEYLGFLCEVAFQGVLAEHEIRKLQHKAGSFALLERSTTDRLRSFPHSEILYYFLARVLVKELAAGKIPLVMRRGVLGSDFLDVYQEVIETMEPLTVAQAIKRIQATLAHEISADQLPYNGGGMLIASLTREFPGVSNELIGLDVNESIISGTACAARLTGVRVARLDVRGADLRRITFTNCQVTDLIVDELTRFGATRPEVNALHKVEADAVSTLRAPVEIRAWLDRYSIAVNGAEGSE